MSAKPALHEAAQAAVRVMAALDQPRPRAGGSLTVIGTGIRAITQLTIESLAAMAEADVLLHVIGEPIQEEAILAINPRAQTLCHYYADGVDRSNTYEAMVQDIVGAVAAGKRTVAAFYGHPGVFTYPSHEAVRRARAAGFPARMLPAVSAADCLYADLGIDPGDGSQAFEATDFVFGRHRIDPAAHLLIWQVGSIGNYTYESSGYDMSMFPMLVGRLMQLYPPGHAVTIYEAAFDPKAGPRVMRLPLAHLHPSQVTLATTLHVPPARH
jgi:uncharacterized protein YabN with tetrapyrrole methylase and pyrophosphatase domain